MLRSSFDFDTITKALKQSYEVINSEAEPSELAIQKLEEAKDLLNEAMKYILEKDRPAI